VATNDSSEKLVHSLKESLQRVESLPSLSNEQTEWVNRLMQHIRAKLAEIEGE
jgi:hypothetical protein